MNIRHIVGILLSIIAAFFHKPLFAQVSVASPDGPHCIAGGPGTLDPDYCGCTWGPVYFRGEPVLNAPVTLTFSNSSQLTYTLPSAVDDPYPVYSLSGYSLGARLNDIMTVTTSIGGQTAMMSFRASPDGQGEQKVPLVVPETGKWLPWSISGYTNTLASLGDTIWAGGPAGILSLNLTTHLSVTHTFPWDDPAVVAITIDRNGHVWAAGAQSLAEFDGTSWQNHAVPISETLRTLTVDPQSGTLWLAAYDKPSKPGVLAVYSDTWQIVEAMSKPITSLTVDTNGWLWAGTVDKGVYRHNLHTTGINANWEPFRVQDGLASDIVKSIASDDQSVWIATGSARGGSQCGNCLLGGISRYLLATGTWQTFGIAQGLPRNVVDVDLPATVTTIVVAPNKQVWAATAGQEGQTVESAVYLLATPELWLRHTMLPTEKISGLTIAANHIFATGASASAQFDPTLLSGTEPTVTIHTSAQTITLDSTVVLTATAMNSDEVGKEIVSWQWMVDETKYLCTTEYQCKTTGELLGLGKHEIGVRVQDAGGIWSTFATIPVTISRSPINPNSVFLPLISGN